MDNEWIKQDIADILYDEGIISKRIYEKCSKPHISSLPYDNRYTDTVKVNERKNAIDEKISETKDNIKTLKQDITKRENILDSMVHDIQQKVNRIDKDLQTVFEDNFGEIGTDRPDNRLREAEYELGDKDGKDTLRFMEQCTKIKSDYDKFTDKLNKSLTKHKNREDIDKIIKSFEKKVRKFWDAQQKYTKKYGHAGYMTTGGRSYADDKAIINILNTLERKSGMGYELTKHYHDGWKKLDNLKTDLKKEQSILKDLQVEKNKTQH